MQDKVKLKYTQNISSVRNIRKMFKEQGNNNNNTTNSSTYERDRREQAY